MVRNHDPLVTAAAERTNLAPRRQGSGRVPIFESFQQALWTAAHHKLAIVFVVLANREYASFAERIGNCAAAGLRSGTALIVELFRWRRHCR
jgi:hypothetical protein